MCQAIHNQRKIRITIERFLSVNSFEPLMLCVFDDAFRWAQFVSGRAPTSNGFLGTLLGGSMFVQISLEKQPG